MTRDPMHTSVCSVCSQGTWYADRAITLPQSAEDRRLRKPPFVTDPSRWLYGNKAHEHGEPGAMHLRMIDRSDLAPAFARYYESGERIRVAFVTLDGSSVYEELTGTIGKTTGWRPAYLLMRTARSHGSPYVLSARDRVVAVKRGSRYVNIPGALAGLVVTA